MEYYQRPLESFSDEIITKVRYSESTKLWYASLDIGPVQYVSDPDFARAASTKEKAIKLCASRVRKDCEGIGRYAPHLSEYDLNFRLKKWWAEKEQG